MRAALFVLVVVSTVGCNFGTNLGSVDAGPGDVGPVVITCTVSFQDPGSECNEDVPECSFGVCKRPCAANDGCNDPATYCNANVGYCEPGCRDSTTCNEGTVCSNGSCIQSTGCATKCDCAAGQVCSDGSCAAPPATCLGLDQCGRGADGDECQDIICNSFTGLCFDPDPAPCTEDSQCIGRPGCAGGCTCTGNQACVPEVACTAGNEAATCGAGNFCDDNGSCQTAPPCAAEAECAPLGLTCNTAGGICQRSAPCTSNAECTTAPATYCNAATDFCAQPLCTNGGVTCSGTQQCTADGRCVAQGPGGPCTVDANCAAAEYCSVVGATGACTVGCRNNASCDPGQMCNGAHTCVGGGGGLGGFGEVCEDSAGCQSGLICGGISGTCTETCDTPSSSCDGGACCALSGQECCNFIGFCTGNGC
jgi:hypothetical protein